MPPPIRTTAEGRPNGTGLPPDRTTKIYRILMRNCYDMYDIYVMGRVNGRRTYSDCCTDYRQRDFAGTELAMVSARRGRLQQKADDGSQGATAALALQDDPNRLLSTVQVGITVISTLTGVFGGASIAETLTPLISTIPYVSSYADTVALGIVVLIISYLSLVLGELVPKRMALQHAEWIAVRMALPMTVMAKLTRPLVWVLTLSTELLLKLAGQRDTNNSAVTEDDIRQLVREGTQSGAVEHHEREIIEGVFGLVNAPYAR